MASSFYELLTGELPFDPAALRSAGPDGMARMIKETEPSKPSTRLATLQRQTPGSGATFAEEAARKRRCDTRTLQRELRGDLDWITLKAMEKERTRRYETANGLALDVRRFLDDEPIAARPPSTMYRLSKTIHKHKVGVIAASAVLVALLAGVTGTSVALVRERAASAEAMREKNRAQESERVAVEQQRIAEQQRALAELSEAKANSSVGRLLQAKGDYAAAEPLFRAAMAIQLHVYGPEHVNVAAALSDLASLQVAIGDYKSAEQTFRQSLAMHQRLLGDNDSRVAESYDKLGAMLGATGQAAAGEAALRRAVEIYRNLPSPDPRGMATALGDLGLLMLRESNPAAAEPLLREALDRWTKIPGYEMVVSTDIPGLSQALTRLLEQRGDHAGAMAANRQYILAILSRISMGLSTNSRDLSLLESHANLSGRVGRFRHALADFEKLRAASPESEIHAMRAACLHLYLGDVAEYRASCRNMVERFGKSTGAHERDRTAKTCFIGVDAVADLAPLLQLAGSNVAPDGPKDYIPLYQLCAGMGEYRAGNHKQAVQWLEKSLSKSMQSEPRVTSMLFLAMANYRLRQEESAREILNAAHVLLEQEVARADAPLIQPEATLQDWLICQIAWREADELILGKHTPPTTRTTEP